VFWLVLAAYLALHVLLRLWETPNIGKNDVQEALAAQGWAWGYHPRNPPLHTWLLMASYSVFGVGLLAHVVLKYVLLGSAYLFAYLSGRRLLSTNALALAGALSLTLLTPFAWTVHTALTHTLLLAVLILATLWAAIRLVAHRRWLDYLVFGAVIGLGFLAKYSYPLFLIPFLAAMACQAKFRRALLAPRALATLAAAVVVFAPHGIWMMSARFDFVAFLAEKQRSEAPQPYWADLGLGLKNLIVGALSFAGPLILLTLLFFRKELRAAQEPRAGRDSLWAPVLMLTSVFALVILALDVAVLRATQFEERYFMCALLLAPLALFLRLDPKKPAISERKLAAFGGAVLVVVLIVGAGLGGRALFYNRTCNRCWDEMAVADFVRRIHDSSGFQHGTIIADHYNLAGNMRIAFPDERSIAANYVVEHPRRAASGECMLVWNARNAGDAAPPLLREYLASRHLSLPSGGGPTYVDAPLRRSADRMDRLAYWVLPNADGNCDAR
jgi:hypothetical protein